MSLQTLVFNTATKTVKLYEGVAESSPIIMIFNDVPTVKVMESFYEVMQTDSFSNDEKRVPVARFPIANTNMLINK
jgi:hypothetical protein